MAKIYCSNCGKEIKEDEEFIVVNDNEVYCGDCTEEDTFTTYRVGGECVGDETDTEEYDSVEQFEKSLKDEIKHWEICLKEYQKTDDEHTINFYKRKLEIAKSKYNDHFGGDNE